MRSTMIFVIVSVALVSCASLRVTPVQPYGKDTFVVSASARSPTKGHSSLVEAANKYCTDAGLVMMPNSEKSSGRTTKTFSLIFSCYSKDDPRYTAPASS